MSEKDENKKKRQRKRIEIGQRQQVQPQNEIQARVLASDILCFEDRPNVISYIRIYVPGEFPTEFIGEKRNEYNWTIVSRKNGVITRSPVTREQYLQINPADDFPKEVQPGTVMILPLEVEE